MTGPPAILVRVARGDVCLWVDGPAIGRRCLVNVNIGKWMHRHESILLKKCEEV